MGLTIVTTTIKSLDNTGTAFEAPFLVDTGAIDTLVPRHLLRDTGILVEGRDLYELADGTPIEYDYGFGRICFMGAETVGKIVFGDDNAEPLLGVVALESTGYGVDPINKTLLKMAAKPLKLLSGPFQYAPINASLTPLIHFEV